MTGELGAGFACRGTAESPSLVHYRSFETWTASQEWQYSLPYGENALVIAVGGLAPPPDELEMGIAGTGTVLVATDKGYVRFLTGSGLQKYLWNLGEEVISMAAGKDWALVVYRGVGGVVDGRQNLEYALIDTDSYEVVQQGKLPLIKGASLNWIGFTDEQVSRLQVELSFSFSLTIVLASRSLPCTILMASSPSSIDLVVLVKLVGSPLLTPTPWLDAKASRNRTGPSA